MRLQDALAELRRHPDTHGMARPGALVMFVYSSDFDDGLTFYWRRDYVEQVHAVNASRPKHERIPLVVAVGRGMEIFSMDDVEADDWRVVTLDSAEGQAYTADTHRPESCPEC